MNSKQKTFLCLGIVILIVLSSLILLALLGLKNDISKIELFVVGLGYILLLLLSIVGLDKVLWHFLTPKDERGDFWCIKKVFYIQTVDLRKLRTKAEELKSNLRDFLKKIMTKS